MRDAIFFAWNNVILRTKSNNNKNQKDWQLYVNKKLSEYKL